MRTLEFPVARVFAPLLEPARYKGAHGGRGSGKGWFFADRMIEAALSCPGDYGGEGLRATCIREVQKDLTQSSKALIESRMRAHGVGERDGLKVYQDRITTPGDGVVIFKGMQDYTAESIKSLEAMRVFWWDEAQNASPTSLAMLTPTMRTKGGEMWFSWNPRLKSDPVDKLFRGEQKPSNALCAQALWSDNPWFPDSLEQERKDCLRINPDQYAHIWQGDYVTVIAGAYFAQSLARAKEEGRITRVPRDPLSRVRVFVDIGGTGAKSDAFAMWVTQFVGREVRVIDYYEAQGQPLATHVSWLRANGYGDASIWLPHDGATHDRVFAVSYESALRDAGFSVEVVPNQGAGAAAARIEALRRLFPSMVFDAQRCAGGLAALGWYHEKRDDKRSIGLGPEHDWASHGADAAGLIAVCYEAPQQARATRKSANTTWVR